MAIYPERKDGSLTGHYRIEVQLKGKRLRGRAGSLSEAKVVERGLTSRLLAPEAPEGTVGHSPNASPPSPTVGLGVKRAEGLLWAGQATEATSLRKLSRVVDIVGKDLPLDAFDSNVLDRVVTALKDSGASDATTNRYLSTISAFLTFCKRRGLKTNAIPEMEWRTEEAGRIRWITYEEEAMLMEVLPEPYADVVHLAIRTGMRASELLDLNPDQIEEQWCHLWKTKNGHARSVPLSKELHAKLTGLISSGSMPSYWPLRNAWEKARRTMALQDDPTFVFHATRHTYATRAVQAGVNPVVLQKLMGHKTIQTTLRYAHVDDRTLSDAALGALAYHDQRGGYAGDVAA